MAISRSQTRKQLTGGKRKKKISKVLKEFKSGKLRSGSKKGPKVKSREQAIAIALNSARKRKA